MEVARLMFNPSSSWPKLGFAWIIYIHNESPPTTTLLYRMLYYLRASSNGVAKAHKAHQAWAYASNKLLGSFTDPKDLQSQKLPRPEIPKNQDMGQNLWWILLLSCSFTRWLLALYSFCWVGSGHTNLNFWAPIENDIVWYEEREGEGLFKWLGSDSE